MVPRSLADDLRGRSPDDLARLLMARPDLMTPAPTEIAALAARAATAPSLSRCLDALNAEELHVLATVTRLSAAEPASKEAVGRAATAGGDPDPGLPERVNAALTRLYDLALVWGPDSAFRAVSALHDLMRDVPTALIPPADLVPVTSAWDPGGTQVDGRAGQAAREFVVQVDQLLDDWGSSPPAALRRGGIAVRDVTSTCERLRMSLPEAGLALELARAGGLLDRDDTERWLPTANYDRWLAGDTAERWGVLARAWLDLPFLPSLQDERTMLATVVSQRGLVVPTRRNTLRLMSEAPAGSGVTPDSIMAVLDYRYPRRAGTARERAVVGTLGEARFLGIVVDDAIGAAGRALIGDDPSSADDALRRSLPAEVTSIVVQSDLTITAPGLLAPADERALRMLADVESRGPALVARMSATTLGRAAAMGLPPADALALLTRLSRTALPQAVTYLIADTERRQVAVVPHVAHRSRTPAPRPVTVRTTNLSARARAIARSLMTPGSQPRPTDLPAPQAPSVSGAAALAELRDALHDGRSTWIEIAESDGTVHRRLVDPIRLNGGTLSAFDHGVEQLRSFSVSRIRSVTPTSATAP